MTPVRLLAREEGKSKILVGAKGLSLALPSMPLPPAITAYYVVDDGAGRTCWKATYDPDDVKRNDADMFKGGTR